MAELTRTGKVSLASQLVPANDKLPRIAGEAIIAGDACYIKNDGRAWKSTGAAANAAAQVDGFALEDASVGEAVTLGWHINLRYGAGLTPGTRYYLSGTVAGGLADAASTGGTAWVAKAIDDTRLYVKRSAY